MSVVLSVIIPAYNVENYVGEAIRSVQDQTFENLEIIVIDDGSTDNTLEVLNDFKDDPRVTLLSQENMGPSGSRNSGIRIARGQYIVCLDAVDRWAPQKAERHIAVMENNPDIDLTFSWWRMINEDGKETGWSGKPQIPRIKLEDLIKETVTGTSSNLVARKKALDSIGMFDPDLQAAVDTDLVLRIAQLRDGNILCIPEILIDYRLREGQITKDWRRISKNWDRVMEKVKAQHPERFSSVEKTARSGQLRYYAYLAYHSGDFPGARQCLFKALTLNPLMLIYNRRTWITLVAVLTTFLPGKLRAFLAQKMEKAWAQLFGS